MPALNFGNIILLGNISNISNIGNIVLPKIRNTKKAGRYTLLY